MGLAGRAEVRLDGAGLPLLAGSGGGRIHDRQRRFPAAGTAIHTDGNGVRRLDRDRCGWRFCYRHLALQGAGSSDADTLREPDHCRDRGVEIDFGSLTALPSRCSLLPKMFQRFIKRRPGELNDPLEGMVHFMNQKNGAGD